MKTKKSIENKQNIKTCKYITRFNRPCPNKCVIGDYCMTHYKIMKNTKKRCQFITTYKRQCVRDAVVGGLCIEHFHLKNGIHKKKHEKK